ncbi:MAG TPA: tripartite tricarboxylate transporter substrate binding protein [Roseomonas sp.]|jgi:tripartite-type tricarboxylate transporter receptor subunit TctC
MAQPTRPASSHPGRRLVLAGLLAAPGIATAQTIPSGVPIRIVVPTGVGGITDILARIIGARLAARLDRTVVIENRPGAGGIIGTEAVVRARPDGTTLLMVFPSHPANPALKANLPYDTERDLAPIGTITTVSLALLVPRDLPVANVAELIALARQRDLNYASVGIGSLAYLAAEMFCSLAGVRLTQVPYRSAPEAHAAVIKGDVAMFFDPPITTLPLLQGGQVRALAVSTRHRLSTLPEVPTVAESGLPGYDVQGWNGLLAPARTPRPVIETYSQALRAILAEPEVLAQLARQGAEPAPSTPEEFGTLISTDIARWGRLLRAAGIQPE